MNLDLTCKLVLALRTQFSSTLLCNINHAFGGSYRAKPDGPGLIITGSGLLVRTLGRAKHTHVTPARRIIQQLVVDIVSISAPL